MLRSECHTSVASLLPISAVSRLGTGGLYRHCRYRSAPAPARSDAHPTATPALILLRLARRLSSFSLELEPALHDPYVLADPLSNAPPPNASRIQIPGRTINCAAWSRASRKKISHSRPMRVSHHEADWGTEGEKEEKRNRSTEA
jgi:hypothetical protein